MKAQTSLDRPSDLHLGEWSTLTSVEQWRERRLSHSQETDYLVPFGPRQVNAVRTLVEAVHQDNGIPFRATQLPPGSFHSNVTFVVSDAAGNANDGSYRGGCSLVFSATTDATDVCVRRFAENELLARFSSSTALEAANAHATLESLVLTTTGDIVEILDSACAVSTFQRHKTHATGLEQVLEQRSFVIRELGLQNRRVFTVWSPRDGIVSLADSGSKKHITALVDGLKVRGLPPACWNRIQRPTFELRSDPGWQDQVGLEEYSVTNNPVPPPQLLLFSDDTMSRRIFSDVLGQRHVVTLTSHGHIWAATGEQCYTDWDVLQPLTDTDTSFIAEQLKKFPDQVPMPQPGAPTTARPRTQLSLPATPHDELRCALNNVLGWNAVSDADLQRTETVVASSEQQSETHGYNMNVLEELMSCTKYLNP